MRYSRLCVAASLVLVLCHVPAWSAPLRYNQARWVQRVRLVFRTHAFAGHSQAEQRKAERAVLSEGRRKATTELRCLLRAQSASDPLRLPIGFTMALLHLDYHTGRQVLLQYLHYETWKHLSSWVVDPEADPSENGLGVGSEYDYVYQVYERHHDPMLMSALLDSSKDADGAGAESLGVILLEVAGNRPRVLLKTITRKEKRVWLRVSDLIAFEMGPEKPPRKALPELARIAKRRNDSLHRAAARLLADIVQAHKRSWPPGCEGPSAPPRQGHSP